MSAVRYVVIYLAGCFQDGYLPRQVFWQNRTQLMDGRSGYATLHYYMYGMLDNLQQVGTQVGRQDYIHLSYLFISSVKINIILYSLVLDKKKALMLNSAVSVRLDQPSPVTAWPRLASCLYMIRPPRRLGVSCSSYARPAGSGSLESSEVFVKAQIIPLPLYTREVLLKRSHSGV